MDRWRQAASILDLSALLRLVAGRLLAAENVRAVGREPYERNGA